MLCLVFVGLWCVIYHHLRDLISDVAKHVSSGFILPTPPTHEPGGGVGTKYPPPGYLIPTIDDLNKIKDLASAPTNCAKSSLHRNAENKKGNAEPLV